MARKKKTAETPQADQLAQESANTGWEARVGRDERPSGYSGETSLEETGARGRDDDREIARRAYERFLARGGQHGHDQEDWYEAERSVRGAGSTHG